MTRWRSVVLFVVVAIVTLVGCIAASSALASTRIDERANARAFATAADGEPVAFERDLVYDSVDGDQISVFYWRPTSQDAPDIPGIPSDADPGQWFASPALVAAFESNPGLANRYPGAIEIGASGVGAADELLAYRLVDESYGVLAERLSGTAGSEWIGERSDLSGTTITAIAIALLALLSVAVLVAALGPVGYAWQRRFALLDALGASGSYRLRVVALHTAIVAAPAALVAALIWWGLAPTQTSIPIVGREVLAEDLTAPLALVLIIAASILMLTGAVTLWQRKASHHPSQTSAFVHAPSFGPLPLTVSLALFLAAMVATGSTGSKLLLVALFGAAISLPMALPQLIGFVAKAAPKSGLVTLLVGRRLETTARPIRALSAFIALAVLAPVASVWVSNNRVADADPAGDTTVHAIEVNGDLDKSLQLEFENQLDGVFATTYLVPNPTPELPPETAWTIPCNSSEITQGYAPCDPAGPPLSTLVPTLGQLGEPLLITPPTAQLMGRIFITANSGAESALRQQAIQTRAFSVVTAADNRLKESRVVPWVLAGLKLFLGAAAFSLVMSVLTHAATTASSRRNLLALGARRSQTTTIAATEAALLILTAGLVASLVGAFGVYTFGQVDRAAATTYTPTVVIVTLVLAAAATAAGAAALAVASSPQRHQ